MKLPEERANELSVVVQNFPFRTKTEISHVPSDITNLIFIGTRMHCADPLRPLDGRLPIHSLQPPRSRQ